MSVRLPVPCSLQPGESLPGLYSRAVTSNHYSSLGLLAWHFGLDYRQRGIHRSDMRHIAMGNVNLERMAEFTQHDIETLKSAALNLGPPCPGGRYDEYVSINRWRYCPACVNENVPHQKLWLVPFATACPIHECELIDSCPACDRPHSVTIPMLPHCYGCQAFPEPRTANAQEIACSTQISRLIDRPEELKYRLDRLMTAWLLSTSESLRAHHRFSPQLASVAEIRARVIHLWPAAQSATALANAIESQIEELQNRWPRFPRIALLLLNRAREMGARLPPRDFVESPISLLSDDDPWWVPQDVAATAVGITGHIMKPLVDKRIIRSKLFTDIGQDKHRHKFRMVDLAHLHDIIDGIYAAAGPATDTSGLVPILSLPLHEVIRDMNKGRLTAYTCEGRELSKLMVRYNETATFTRRTARPPGTMTAEEVAQHLTTYHAVVSDLARRKILKLHSKSQSQRLLFDRSAVEAFHNQYVLVGNLAKDLKQNQTNLAEKLASLGILPAPLEAIVTIYRRSDTEGVSSTMISNLKEYQTKAGRKSTVDAADTECSRTKRLIQLVAEHGGGSAFSRKIGCSSGTLSMVMREKKPFSRAFQKRIEKEIPLPADWFSSPN